MCKLFQSLNDHLTESLDKSRHSENQPAEAYMKQETMHLDF